MKVGVSMYSYVSAVRGGRMDLVGFIREAQRIGGEGVELLDFFYQDPEADRQRALATLAETGLPCAVFSVAQNFAKASAEERDSQLAKIRFGVDEAVRFGAGVVRVFAGDAAEGMSFDDARGWIVEGLAKASAYAYDRGVRLALENHGRLAGRGDQVRDIIRDVRQMSGNDALGANPDTGNFLLVNQRSDEAIREVAQYAYMVHFKDFRRAPADFEGFTYAALDGSKFYGTVIGEGDVPLSECIRILREAGFDGWLNVEYEGEQDPIAGVARSVETAKRLVGS